MFFLVLGEIPAKRNLFSISISDEITFGSQLRNAIYKIKENTFTNIDENQLILWKVNIPINDENMRIILDKASHESHKVNIDFKGVELYPADAIPNNFNESPENIRIARHFW